MIYVSFYYEGLGRCAYFNKMCVNITMARIKTAPITFPRNLTDEMLATISGPDLRLAQLGLDLRGAKNRE